MPRPSRLLFLLHCTPAANALHGGGRLIAHLIAGMAERRPVAVVHLRDVDEPAMEEELRAKCELVFEVPRTRTRRRLPARVLHRLKVLGAPLVGMPPWAAHLPGRRFADVVRDVLTRWRPEIVQLEFSVMGRYLPALRDSGAARVLSHHMPGSDAEDSFRKSAGRPSAALATLRRAAWERFERRVMHNVDAVVTFTEQDRELAARQAGTTPVWTIPIGTAVPLQPSSPLGTSPDTILFVGNYGHPPNRDGASRLAYRILPLVREHRPGARLWLVGASSDRLEVVSSEYVQIIGQVPDIGPYFEAAAVVAAPLRQGGGIRIKVLETLAAGKALVASARALQGIPAQDGSEVVIAKSDREFAAQIVRLLADDSLREALARQARRWAEANLGWGPTLDALERVYDLLPHRDGTTSS